METKINLEKTFGAWLAILGGVLLASLAGCTQKPEWLDRNKEVIDKLNIEGRIRHDIPDSKIIPNLEPGLVTSFEKLPEIEIAPGVRGRIYWGKGNLVCWLKLMPGAEIAQETLSSERILVVINGSVEQLVGGKSVTMRAVQREEPDGTHGGTPRNDFLLLEPGAENALRAGEAGAEIIEVYWPPRLDYLAKAGAKKLPNQVNSGHFPLEPSVKPSIVHDLHEIQFVELSSGANSRLVWGRGAQLSFLSLSPNATFPAHLHPEEQLMIITRGWIDQLIIDKTVRMEKGNVLLIPANMVHGGKTGSLGCDVVDIFWPPRPDYANKMARRMEAYRSIIPEGARAELVVDGTTRGPGLYFTEGPKWLNGKLYFSSMYFDQKWQGDPRKSAIVEMDPNGVYRYISYGQMQSNGLMPLPSGNLAICDMFGHRVIEMTTRGKVIRTLASAYNGKPLDGPNDLVVDAKGGIYFTDPQFTPDVHKNQPGRSVYYLSPEGDVIRVIEPDAFAMPNGVLLSPDGKTLYINNTYDDEVWWNVNSDKDNFIWAYDVRPDGTLANGRRFAELFLTPEVLDRQGRSAGADGMAIDELGNIYVATYMGLQMFTPRGEFIGIVNFPIFPVSCCFGDEDMKTLYATCYNRIYRIRTNVRGLSYPLKSGENK